MDSDPVRGNRDNYNPNPLPQVSLVTNEQLIREIYHLKVLIDARIEGTEETQAVLKEKINGFHGALDRECSKILSLMGEKFNAVDIQIRERDMRFQMIDNNQKESAIVMVKTSSESITAALEAQKRLSEQTNASNNLAINKSEIATGKELEGIKTLLTSYNNTANDKIANINARLDRTEGRATGFAANVGTGLSGIAVLISLLVAIGAFKGNSTAQSTRETVVTIPSAPRSPQ